MRFCDKVTKKVIRIPDRKSKIPITKTIMPQISNAPDKVKTYHNTSVPRDNLIKPANLMIVGEVMKFLALKTRRRSKKTEAPTVINAKAKRFCGSSIVSVYR